MWRGGIGSFPHGKPEDKAVDEEDGGGSPFEKAVGGASHRSTAVPPLSRVLEKECERQPNALFSNRFLFSARISSKSENALSQ